MFLDAVLTQVSNLGKMQALVYLMFGILEGALIEKNTTPAMWAVFMLRYYLSNACHHLYFENVNTHPAAFSSH